jgi:hypothetical protein
MNKDFRQFRKNGEKWLITSSCLLVCPPVRPSVRTGQLFSHWTDFHVIWCLNIFRKFVGKIQASLKSEKITAALYEGLCTCMIISRSVLRNISEQCCIGNQNTWSIILLWKSCYLWENVEKYGTAGQATDDNIIRRMRIACWITKATNIHWGYVILIAFPRQQ